MFYLDDDIQLFINYCKQQYIGRNKNTQPEFEIRINSIQKEMFDFLLFELKKNIKKLSKKV